MVVSFGTPKIISDIIEATECLRAWWKDDLIRQIGDNEDEEE